MYLYNYLTTELKLKMVSLIIHLSLHKKVVGGGMCKHVSQGQLIWDSPGKKKVHKVEDL